MSEPASERTSDELGAPASVPPGTGKHQAVQRVWPLTLAALGVVFGDIGTSPLYAIKECFVGAHGVSPTHDNVLGVLSLVFWSLTVVVAVKYIGFIMRADNKGEGGIFSLLALGLTRLTPGSRLRTSVVLVSLFGAALLYGDGIITPAISVLSAVEGLGEVQESFATFVVPITVMVLLVVFSIQSRGTEGIGKVFGPIMVAWFVAIAALGLWQVIQRPEVIAALSPDYGVRFFIANQWHGFVVLGAVVLCITGGEALYADMGHFGRRPIRLGWFAMVFPALLLNYFGQGAKLLEAGALGEKIDNPFYALVPHALRIPMVLLATAATVIASQALISGVFSLTRQAVQLGFWPRVNIVHTSERNEGQIYVPEMNRWLAVACVALVLTFKQSSALAAAYGIAVTGTMGITSIVYYFVVTRVWGWKVSRALPLVAVFLFFDFAFFGANLIKFFDGGWFPMAVALGLFTLMTTWQRGRQELAARFAQTSMPIEALLEDLEAHQPHRVRGTAVFMSGSAEGTPPVLLHHLKHNQILHRQVVLLSILPSELPVVPKAEQITVTECGNGFWRVVARSGFMQSPNVPDLLRRARTEGLVCEPSTTSYYLGRETLLTSGKSKMSGWRKGLFAFISKVSRPATSYFNIPPGRVVELGMQVDL